MKTLAVIGKILSTAPIEGADRIHTATAVCGEHGKWTGVVPIDITVGQKVLVFLQDAILPPSERWNFMASKKYRIRMARFKGAPSECLIIPLNLDELALEIGHDMTLQLGVTKYEKELPAQLAGMAKGTFPPFIPKTDETNYQAVKKLQEILDTKDLYARLKCDGSSCTVWRHENEIHVASRNLELKRTDNSAYFRVADMYNFQALPDDVALQFEVVGPGIQKNKMRLSTLEGRAFTAYNYKEHRRLTNSEFEAVCTAVGIPEAKKLFSIGAGTMKVEQLRDLVETVKYAEGDPAEGMVLRDLDSTVSFKVINLLYKD